MMRKLSYHWSVHSDEGSILVSTFSLLLFITFLITSLTVIIRHQLIQYHQLSDAYEMKALLNISEQLLRETEFSYPVSGGVIEFSNGQVTVKQMTESTYILEAVMPDNRSRSVTVEIVTEHVEESSIESLVEDTDSTGESNDASQRDIVEPIE